MKNLLLLLAPLFLLASCRQGEPRLQEELAQAQQQLGQVTAELELLKAGPEKGQLVHIVFLKLREGLPEEEVNRLITGIKKLEEIEVVKYLEVGKIADTGDPRFISNHDIAFQMNFASMEHYEIYQNHPAHLQVREGLTPSLAGPPAVYDYWVE